MRIRGHHRKGLPGKWKIVYFWPKDFTFVSPTEIVGFDRRARQFEERDAVLMVGPIDNEFSKLGWRHGPKDLSKLGRLRFGDSKGALVNRLGIRDQADGVALRATFIVDPDNVIQYVSVNNLNRGRNTDEILRILDALQTDELCPYKRGVGSTTP